MSHGRNPADHFFEKPILRKISRQSGLADTPRAVQKMDLNARIIVIRPFDESGHFGIAASQSREAVVPFQRLEWANRSFTEDRVPIRRGQVQ